MLQSGDHPKYRFFITILIADTTLFDGCVDHLLVVFL